MGDFKFLLVFVVLVIIGALYERNRKRKSQAGASLPTPAPVAQNAAPVSLAGRYALQIVMPDQNVWGDGTHPFDKQEIALTPDHLGSPYRLGGTLDIDRDASGRLSVVAIIHGRRNPVTGSHSVQMVPMDGREIEFPLHGAWCYLMFGTDGTVTGRVFEPEGWVAGGGFDRHNCWKYGDVVGRKA